MLECSLRSARRWSRRLGLLELSLASEFIKRRGVDYSRCWNRVPPLEWVERELRYWMPALVRHCFPARGHQSIEIRFGILVLAVESMYYDLLHDSPRIA